ncbi:hypothetical protein OIV83_005384, partial [Microbotryomycetes sp. JL201]
SQQSKNTQEEIDVDSFSAKFTAYRAFVVEQSRQFADDEQINQLLKDAAQLGSWWSEEKFSRVWLEQKRWTLKMSWAHQEQMRKNLVINILEHDAFSELSFNWQRLALPKQVQAVIQSRDKLEKEILLLYVSHLWEHSENRSYLIEETVNYFVWKICASGEQAQQWCGYSRRSYKGHGALCVVIDSKMPAEQGPARHKIRQVATRKLSEYYKFVLEQTTALGSDEKIQRLLKDWKTLEQWWFQGKFDRVSEPFRLLDYHLLWFENRRWDRMLQHAQTIEERKILFEAFLVERVFRPLIRPVDVLPLDKLTRHIFETRDQLEVKLMKDLLERAWSVDPENSLWAYIDVCMVIQIRDYYDWRLYLSHALSKLNPTKPTFKHELITLMKWAPDIMLYFRKDNRDYIRSKRLEWARHHNLSIETFTDYEGCAVLEGKQVESEDAPKQLFRPNVHASATPLCSLKSSTYNN